MIKTERELRIYQMRAVKSFRLAGWSKSRIAKQLGMDSRYVTRILNGDPPWDETGRPVPRLRLIKTGDEQ